MISVRQNNGYYCIFIERGNDYFLFGIRIVGRSIISFYIYQYQTEKYGSSINIDNYKYIDLSMKDLSEVESIFTFGTIKTKILNYIKKHKKDKEFIEMNFNDINVFKIFEKVLKGDDYVKNNQ